MLASLTMRHETTPADFPETLRISTEKSGTYTRVPRHFAVHGALPEAADSETPTPDLTVVGRLEAEDVTFVSLKDETLPDAPTSFLSASPEPASPEPTSPEPTPVYATSKGAPLMTPTGEVFVRLAASLNVKDFIGPMQDAGYDVSTTLAYAPQAAWLKARSGSTVEALRRIPHLEALPEVENVEPQMLAIRTHR